MKKKPGGPNINIFKTFITFLFPADDFFFKIYNLLGKDINLGKSNIIFLRQKIAP